MDQLVGDIGRYRVLRKATLRRRQALPECGVGLGEQCIGTSVVDSFGLAPRCRAIPDTMPKPSQVTQRTRGGLPLRAHADAAGSKASEPVAPNGSGPPALNGPTCCPPRADNVYILSNLGGVKGPHPRPYGAPVAGLLLFIALAWPVPGFGATMTVCHLSHRRHWSRGGSPTRSGLPLPSC